MPANNQKVLFPYHSPTEYQKKQFLMRSLQLKAECTSMAYSLSLRGEISRSSLPSKQCPRSYPIQVTQIFMKGGHLCGLLFYAGVRYVNGLLKPIIKPGSYPFL